MPPLGDMFIEKLYALCKCFDSMLRWKESKFRKRFMKKEKTCRKCGLTRKLTQFTKDKSKGDGYSLYCKDCKNSMQRKYYSKESYKQYKREYHLKNIKGNEAYKDYQLQRNYGITIQEYNKLLKKQKNVCAICGKEETSKKYSCLSVDHDHKTGVVRGLLCSRCNLAVGVIENTDLLKILKYLKIPFKYGNKPLQMVFKTLFESDLIGARK